MAVRLSTSARNAIATAIVTLVDAGAGPGKIEIRTGAQPATPNTAATGTLLATVLMDDPSFTGPVTGVITAAGFPNSDPADADGAAGWFRILDSNNAAVIDGSCSGSGGGGDMVIDNPSLLTGQVFSINSLTVTMPVG